MIHGLSTSDAPAYVPTLRPEREKPTCSCGPANCRCPKIGDSTPARAPHASSTEVSHSNPKASDPSRSVKTASETKKVNSRLLTETELAIVRELKQRDRQVRQHETAHLAAGAGLVRGGPSYTYQRGPDGQSYAVGGEVHIDMSKGKTPEETVQKARTVRAAALAPADPSGTDRAIAARATQMEMQAQIQLVEQQTRQRNTLPGTPRPREETDSPQKDSAPDFPITPIRRLQTQHNGTDPAAPVSLSRVQQVAVRASPGPTPAERLGQRIFSSITPPSAQFMQVAV